MFSILHPADDTPPHTFFCVCTGVVDELAPVEAAARLGLNDMLKQRKEVRSKLDVVRTLLEGSISTDRFRLEMSPFYEFASGAYNKTDLLFNATVKGLKVCRGGGVLGGSLDDCRFLCCIAFELMCVWYIIVFASCTEMMLV